MSPITLLLGNEMPDEILEVFSYKPHLLCGHYGHEVPFFWLSNEQNFSKMIPYSLKFSEVCSISSGEGKVGENILEWREKLTEGRDILLPHCKLALKDFRT